MHLSSNGDSSKKKTSSLQVINGIGAEKVPFGSRFLTDDVDVWSQNAWDHVPPPDDQLDTIVSSLAKQRLAPVPQDDKVKYNNKPAKHWDNFYKMNASNFFRDRKWLHNEFPELVTAAKGEAGPMLIAEIGCGAGNSVFPLLSTNENPNLFLHAYDYSSHAVKLVQTNPLYTAPPVGSITASVWDVTSEELPPGIDPGSFDIVILVFIMSALHPDEWSRAITNIHKILKPGGLVFFRDYGRYDLTQMRFKSGRLLDENFYIRGDKTRVYFFELDEISLLFTGSRSSSKPQTPDSTELMMDPHPPPLTYTDDNARVGETSGLPLLSGMTTVHKNLLSPFPNCPPHPLFTVEQLGVDRRLLVNRKRQLKMYRVWLQGKFRKH